MKHNGIGTITLLKEEGQVVQATVQTVQLKLIGNVGSISLYLKMVLWT